MSKTTWNSDPAFQAIRKAAADSLKEEAQVIGDIADDTAPNDEGDMISTRTVTRKQLVARITYPSPYAVRQHESRKYRHRNGRRAKWLELTINEQAHLFAGRIAGRIARRLQ